MVLKGQMVPLCQSGNLIAYTMMFVFSLDITQRKSDTEYMKEDLITGLVAKDLNNKSSSN